MWKANGKHLGGMARKAGSLAVETHILVLLRALKSGDGAAAARIGVTVEASKVRMGI